MTERHDAPAAPISVRLHEVAAIAALADGVVARFEQEVIAVFPDLEVHHVGATAMPFGHTKGDVDVNLRVSHAAFSEVVARLRKRLEIAQPENWTPTYASFETDRYALPLGVQVTVIGSPDDFLLTLRDTMRSQPELLWEYDARKVGAAALGHAAYREAKRDFVETILSERALRPSPR